jgi:hypothetical protein
LVFYQKLNFENTFYDHLEWGMSFQHKKSIHHLNSVRDIFSVHLAIFEQQGVHYQLKEKLPELVEKWEEIIGVKAETVRVKNMLTRWGTCNTKDKRIWINLQLAKKPIECLEYVIVHELVHLLEKSHNSVFVDYMDKFLPDWRVTKDLLNGFIMDSYVEE